MIHQTWRFVFLLWTSLWFSSQSLGSTYTSLGDNLQPGEIKVALLLPLSGEKEALGQSLLEAAHMALTDANQPITLYPIDTNKRDNLLEDIRTLQPTIILGPVFGQETKEIATRIPQSIPLFTLSNDPDLLNKGIFVMGFSPFQEATFLLDFALKKGHKRFAVLLPETPLGHALEETCKEFFEDKEESALHVLFYSTKEDTCLDTISNWVHQLNTFEPDVLFVPNGSVLTQKLVATLKFKDLHYRRIRFLGSSMWDKASVFKDSSLRGLWVASNRTKALHHFYKRFQSTFQETGNALGALLYDAVRFIASSNAHTKAALLTHKEKGLYGTLSFREDGAIRRPFHVLEHKGRGVKRIA
jgi:branched-chain amino acid transport system substrate-binding protein